MTRIAFGGDYNPEQWDRATRRRDRELFARAGIDTVTLGIFSWTLWQPGPERWDFSELDEVIDEVSGAGLSIILATPTGSRPAWMSAAHPEVERVDFEGRRHRFGARHNACPSSPVFRAAAVEVAGRLAERYAGLANLRAWHIGNEFGGSCYCELCAAAFRRWLLERYGDLDEINRRWYTRFWNHTFTDVDQIVPPNALSEHWSGRPDQTSFQPISLDYQRFASDALLGQIVAERDAIRAHSAGVPITTNLMGNFKPADYTAWARELDVVSWDNYPIHDPPQPAMAMWHDLMRGIGDGRPFWLMEQTPSVTSWRPHNPLKPPGVMRLWSWQAVAHGADAVLYFQLRQSRGASEQFHGAVIDHTGRDDTRTFAEVSELGAELVSLAGEITGARSRADVALVFDWEAWWALELSDGPNDHVGYLAQQQAWYRAWYEAGIACDVVGSEADLSGYRVICAPQLFLVRDGVADRLRAAVEAGATLVTTVLSGRVDATAMSHTNDLTGPFAELCGIRVDETDSQPPDRSNAVVTQDGRRFDCSLVHDLVRPAGAEVVARYAEDFYAGTPAITRNAVGAGAAWWVGTQLGPDGIAALTATIAERVGIAPVLAGARWPLEVTERIRDSGERYLFVLNHGDTATTVVADRDGTSLLDGSPVTAGARLPVGPNGVLIVRS